MSTSPIWLWMALMDEQLATQQNYQFTFYTRLTRQHLREMSKNRLRI
jgi:hypothetical protein